MGGLDVAVAHTPATKDVEMEPVAETNPSSPSGRGKQRSGTPSDTQHAGHVRQEPAKTGTSVPETSELFTVSSMTMATGTNGNDGVVDEQPSQNFTGVSRPLTADSADDLPVARYQKPPLAPETQCIA